MNLKIINILFCILLIVTSLSVVGKINHNRILEVEELNDFQKIEFVPGEFIVKFKPDLKSSQSINNLNEKYKVISMKKVFTNVKDTSLKIFIF